MTAGISRAEVVRDAQDMIWNDGGMKQNETKLSKSPPHSLIISPNLDALLEFDEKVRGTCSISPTRDLPQSAPLVPTFSVGLPPPPRGRRKPCSPTSPQVSSPLTQGATTTAYGSPASNPYINPAPSLERLRLDNEPRDQFYPETTDDGGRIQYDSRSSVDLQQPPKVSLPSTTAVATKNRVDRLLNIRKIPFSLLEPKAELKEVSNIPTTNKKVQLPLLNLRERARARGKLLKLKDTAPNRSSQTDMRQVDIVMDIRRQEPVREGLWTPLDPDNELEVDLEFHQRPLSSHDLWLRSRRRSSSDSFSSSSATHGPASTIDPRISISSTIYPASSSHSHPRDMYHTADQLPTIPPHRSSSLHQPSVQIHGRNTDRESFIDIVSPTAPEFTSSNLHEYQPNSQPNSQPTSSPKPPIPTTPKPTFNRLSPRISPRQRYDEPTISDELPPTTNFLDLDERSDLIRKNRKLAQVFGQPPGPVALPQQEIGRANKHPLLLTLSSSNNRHQRGALSMSNNLDIVGDQRKPRPLWPSAADTQYININDRRHSAPLSPEDFSFLKLDMKEKISSNSDDRVAAENSPSSPTSFIDLSDDLGSASLATPKKAGLPRSSSQSLFENLSPEERAEEDRRRKREKLAKLHRFLGSRVPTNLVLGLNNDSEASLPPPANAMTPPLENEEGTKKAWLRRRRSSSVVAYPSKWSDEVDRIKEDLTLREKAINVRRAQKMEKVFGVAPPQTLYHTRHSPSLSVTNVTDLTEPMNVSGWTPLGETLTLVSGQRNPNRTLYTKPKKDQRPSTSESNKQLLPKRRKGRSDSPDFETTRKTSVIYSHFQDSLNSLNDIIDRDDKASLAELHEYLNGGDMSVPPPLQPITGGAGDRRLSSASSIKSERRRSLPARTSMISVASEYSISSPHPEVTDFQARRRRAAKLTQFFGVDYRELICDVLESIEHGLEHEQKRGTLNPDEVEDLLARLRNLRTQRVGSF